VEEVLITRKQAAAEHDRVHRLAREGRIAELIHELDNPHRYRFLIIRGAAASRLGMLGAVAAAKPVARLLDDPVPEVRQAAARALGRIGVSSPEIISALNHVVTADEANDVRGVAIGSLGELRDPAVVARARPLLTHPAASVRFPAMYALLLTDDSAAKESVRTQLRAEKWYMWPYRRRLTKDVQRFRDGHRNA
jgi:HEAT repeat protein